MSESHQLADLLQELKERSGRSYTALASRTGLSRSSVHRYCQGLTVPASFGMVERIARVCGAGQEELDRLYTAWTRAEAQAREAESEAAADPEATDPEATDPEATDPATEPSAAQDGTRDPTQDAPRRTTQDATHDDAQEAARDDARGSREAPQHSHRTTWFARTSPRQRLRTLLIAVIVAASVVSAVTVDRWSDPGGTGSGGKASGGAADRPSGQQIDGPYWALAPKPLDREFFGITMNTDTGLMPGFSVSGVRLWESETRWAQIEPEQGKFDWEILERSVKGAERKRLPILFVFGGTPGWAAPGGPKTPYPDDSRAAPPDDLADWDRFVEAVATRYRSRIGAYELWDSVGATSHYDGNMSTLAEMVRRAARIIKRADPDAKVACPSFGKLWEPEGRALFKKFVRTGAYEFCDAAALKLHPRRADGPPEEIIELAAQAEDIFRESNEGQRVRVWNTGPGAEIDDGARLSDRRANDYAVRFYLVGLYIRKSNVDRMYFYAWGGRNIPLVVQLVGGRPTEAGRRIGRLHGWLADKRITSCGKGSGVGLPDGVFECVFRRGQDREPDAVGPWLAVRWTQHGRASSRLSKGAYLLRRMDGSSERVRAGKRVEYGETPVLVEYRA
ncbi:helix-turn-helix domain-containing protein [Streptomyces sp. HC44]|uniref:Helix-turn-helix domain-containing protein n=1 Tax=Streptomyces scabichelini TaxID=2711217 RepID=A0A6G4VHH4_9ACTN|nr:helix-turn-helix domain-containing protein [Streptomyces scabichelini]NGO13602.1 helix-turn-helix domain-containing protein [Streptomyces scabichelini]